MTESPKTYYSKIILFGEYTVICGSSFLSAPCRKFSARFGFPESAAGEAVHPAFPEAGSQEELRKYLDYLKGISGEHDLLQHLDLSRMEDELSSGLCFYSGIREQYGLGSSGALCAAIFDRYFRGHPSGNEGTVKVGMEKLKETFSAMEAYFHGSSSGMDPLVCHTGKPVLIRAGGKIDPVQLPDTNDSSWPAFFLFDTGMRSRTGPLVNLFRKKYHDPAYRREVDKQLMPATERCITNLLTGKPENLLNSCRELSRHQLNLLGEMIPGPFTDLWRRGLESGDYCMKLCGSGGGGYLLGLGKVPLQSEAGPDVKGRILMLRMDGQGLY